MSAHLRNKFSGAENCWMRAKTGNWPYKILQVIFLFLFLSSTLLISSPAQAKRSFTASPVNHNIRDNDISRGDLEINYSPQDILIARDNPSITIKITIRNKNPSWYMSNIILYLVDEKYRPWFNSWPSGPWFLVPSQEISFDLLLSIPEYEKEPEDRHEIVIAADYAGLFRAVRTMKVKVMPAAVWFQDVRRNIDSLPVEYQEWNPEDSQSMDLVRKDLMRLVNNIREEQDPLNFPRVREFLNGVFLITQGLTAAETSFRQKKFLEAGQMLGSTGDQFPTLLKYPEWENRPEFKELSNQVFSILNRINNAAQKKFFSHIEITLIGNAERLRQEAVTEENKAKGSGIPLSERYSHYKNAVDSYRNAADLFSISQKEMNQNISRALREKVISIEEVTLIELQSQIDLQRSYADSYYQQAIQIKNQAPTPGNLTTSAELFMRALELLQDSLEELQRIGDAADSIRISDITNNISQIGNAIAQVREEIRIESEKAVKSEGEGDNSSHLSSELKMVERLDSFKTAQKYYEEALGSLNRIGSPEDSEKAVIIASKLENSKNNAEALEGEINNLLEAAEQQKKEAAKVERDAEKEQRLASKKLLLASAKTYINSEIDMYTKFSSKPEDLMFIGQAMTRLETLEKKMDDLDQEIEKVTSESEIELKSVEASLKLMRKIPVWPVAMGNYEQAQEHLASAASYLDKIGDTERIEILNRYHGMLPEMENYLKTILSTNIIILLALTIIMSFALIRYFSLLSLRREISLERSLFE